MARLTTPLSLLKCLDKMAFPARWLLRIMTANYWEAYTILNILMLSMMRVFSSSIIVGLLCSVLSLKIWTGLIFGNLYQPVKPPMEPNSYQPFKLNNTPSFWLNTILKKIHMNGEFQLRELTTLWVHNKNS